MSVESHDNSSPLPQDRRVGAWGTWQDELWLFLFAAAVPLLLGIVAWKHRDSVASKSLGAMLYCQAAWTIGQGAELWVNGLAAKLWLDGLQYVAVIGASVSTLVFALRYSQVKQPPWLLPIFAGLTLPVVLVLITAPLHRYGRMNAELVPGDPFTTLDYSFHPFDLLLTVVAVTGQVAGLVILVRHLGRASRAYFRGTLFVIMGVLLPLIMMLVSAAIGVRILGQRDLSFICFGFAGAAIAWGLYRERVLSLVPVAREIMFERVPDPVIVCDREGRILDLNNAASSLMSFNEGEAIGAKLEAVFSLVFEVRILTSAPVSQVVVLPVRTGGRVFEGVWHEVHEAQGGRLYLLRDVTVRQRELDSATQSLRQEEQRRTNAEDGLRQAQKMDALGRLAGGVAHDFNNLLTVILANNEMAIADCRDPALVELLEQTRIAAESAAALTQQLLVFGRKNVVAPTRISLKEELVPIKTMLSRLIRADIAVHFDVAADVAETRFDVSQLQQLLVNLAVNARDAMPSGGTLRVTAQNVRRPAPSGLDDKDWICLSVADSGAGIAEADIPRIFEPFFTTKEVGKGTGLGLSLVYGSVVQHGGFVEVQSQLGEGSTFLVYLPRAISVESQIFPRAKERVRRAAPSGVVLVVEDHDGLCMMVTRMLKNFGFQVKSFSSASALIAQWESMERPLLLLSDVVMPECSGIDLAEQTQVRWPGLPVLFMSGYSDDERLARHVKAGLPFISKPFSGPQLLERVLQALDESSTSRSEMPAALN